ncbi:MAG: hypothetical protein ACR2PW_04760 [Gammaproteobacteria bacterium]
MANDDATFIAPTTLAALARREVSDTGGGPRLATDARTGVPTQGKAATNLLLRQLSAAGIGAHDVVNRGGDVRGAVADRFGSRAVGSVTGGSRPSVGLSNADLAVMGAIPSFPGMLAGLFGVANRAFGPLPGVVGPIAPAVGTPEFSSAVNAGSIARGLAAAGLDTVGVGPSGIP